MIRGVHTMFYTSDADGLRAFCRDTLQLPTTDVGAGWLIFDLPEAELGCHPADAEKPGGQAGTHNISFYCDNLEQTMADLQSRGVEFTMPVEDHGYGLVTMFKLPGDVIAQLYQPRYPQRWSRPQPATDREASAESPARKPTRRKKRRLAPAQRGKKSRRVAAKAAPAKKSSPAARRKPARRR